MAEGKETGPSFITPARAEPPNNNRQNKDHVTLCFNELIQLPPRFDNVIKWGDPVSQPNFRQQDLTRYLFLTSKVKYAECVHDVYVSLLVDLNFNFQL